MSDDSDDGIYKDIFGGDGDGLGLNTWVGIIAGVLSGLSILTIAAVYLTQRKCCKQKKEDSESILLKKRLQIEQKKMATYKCKFPFIDHPSCTSIMQQENNDIADEVKEIYSKISTNISKPIICCPEKKASYCYNPKSPSTSSTNSDKLNFNERKQSIEKVIQSINKNISDHDNVDTSSVHEIASEALQKIANSPYEKRHITCNEFTYDPQTIEYIDSLEKYTDSLDNKSKTLLDSLEIDEDRNEIEENRPTNIPKSPQIIKSSKNLFTESEIHNAADMKSLFFEKWMKHTGDPDEVSEESIHKDASISYDDVDSVLTSISRMDSNRMKKLRNTRFYKKMVSGMQSIKSESVSNEKAIFNENENVHDKENNNRNIEKYNSTQFHLTQEELNHIALQSERIAHIDSSYTIKHKHKLLLEYSAAERKKDAILRAKALTDISDEENFVERKKADLDGKSEDLFRVVHQSNSPRKYKTTLKEKSPIRRCSSCSESENSLEDGKQETVGHSKGKFYCKPDNSFNETKQSNKLTNWSKTRTNNIKNSNVQKSICETEFTKTNKSDSYVSPKHSVSSCSCSSKTTTWEEIALKEKERLKEFSFSDDLENIDLETKDMSKSDVFYIISNNNCFMLPMIDEQNGCSESDITHTSYYLDEKKKLLEESQSRNTT